MNTHTFDNHYVTCPLCHRNANPEKVKTCIGLFSCPYCQERFVVSASGHYVRDPFAFKQMVLATTLRRQSHPVSRIIRDFIFVKRPLVAFVVGSLVMATTFILMQQNTHLGQQQLPRQEKTLGK